MKGSWQYSKFNPFQNNGLDNHNEGMKTHRDLEGIRNARNLDKQGRYIS